MSKSYAKDATLNSLYVRSGGIRISDTDTELPGMIRYNPTNKTIETYTGENGPLGETWRELTLDIASGSKIGGIRIGSNLTVQSDGVLSSIAEGESRLNQHVITVSKETGKADYDNLTDAITYINDLITSNDSDKPSVTNPYKIVLSPGVYVESITLPDYVSLEGEGQGSSIVRSTSGSSTLADSAVITLGSYSNIEDIEIQHYQGSSSYSVGLYLSSESNNVCRNVKIVMGNNSLTAGSDVYGFYISSASAPVIDNLTIDISQGTGDLYGLYVSNTSPLVYNTRVTIDAPGDNNYGSYHTTGAEGEYYSSYIDVKGGTTNIALKTVESTPYLHGTNLIADSEENNSRTSYALENQSSDYKATLTSSVISFTANSSNRDQIDVSGSNFVTEGFEAQHFIQVSGASNSQNNTTFLVDGLDSDTLFLSSNDDVTTESVGQSITINQLHTIKLDHCVLRGTTAPVRNTNANGHYAIRGEKSTFLGAKGDSIVNGGIMTFESYQSITVSQQGGDFTSLSGALNAINDNSQFRRYIIIVKPGTYTESSSITLKSYVNVMGSGMDQTIIKGDVTSSTLASSTLVTGASNIEISEITFNNLHSSSSNTYATCFYGSSTSNLNLRKVKFQTTGTITGTNQGLYLSSGSSIILEDIKSIVNGGSTNNKGIVLTLSDIDVYGGDISISGGSSTANYGLEIDRTTLDMVGTKITVSGSTGTNRGIYTVNPSGTEYATQFQSCNVNCTGSGAYSVYTADNQILVGAGSNLVGATYYNGSSGAQSVMRLNSCWKIVNNSGNLVYTPISTLGVSLSSTNGNLFVGDNAGNPDLTGTGNTGVGTDSAASLTTANNSTMLGSKAGNALTTGSNNTFTGRLSGSSTTSGTHNSFYGFQSGTNNIAGDYNTGIGSNSLKTLVAGNRNTTLGYGSGEGITFGNDNTLVGHLTGNSITFGTGNVMVGGSSGTEAAGYSTTTGEGNVILGFKAGYSNVSGSDSVIIGREAGQNTLPGETTLIGAYAGKNLTTGTKNTMIGFNAGLTSSTGVYNTLIGAETGENLTTGGFNLIAGNRAGNSLTTGRKNVLLGSASSSSGSTGAGYSMTSGSENVVIGVEAGDALITGDKNTIVGTGASSGLTTGGRNTTLGYQAGYTQTTQTDNVLIGYYAGRSNNNSGSNLLMIGSNAGANSDCSTSIFIGKEAGQYSSGSYNIGLGYQALKNQTLGAGSGVGNVFMGHHSGRNIRSASRNVGIGGGTSAGSQGVLSSLTTADDNTVIGYLAGQTLTSSKNTIIGSYAGNSLISGQGNTLMGYRAGYGLTASDLNVLIGIRSGESLTVGDANTFVGADAGNNSITSSSSIAIGYRAGYVGTSGNFWIAIGNEAGYNNLADSVVSIGYQAGRSNTSGANNIFIGYQTGVGGVDPNSSGANPTNMTGGNNIFMGYRSGFSATAATRNVLVGYRTGYSMTTGQKNIMMGDNAGYSLTTGNQNIFIGSGSNDTSGPGYSTTTANQNVFIGFDAGKSNVDGSRNMYLGSQAGQNSTGGTGNICAGYRAGNQMVSASYNVYIGFDAGYYNQNGSSNICIGYRAGRSGVSASTYTGSICIGREAGYNNQQDNVIFIGFQAGYTNTSGQSNIGIGYRAGYANQTGSGNISIGNSAGRNNIGDNGVFLGTNAGLNNTTGDNNVAVGTDAGRSNATGNNNIYFGYRAGFNTTNGNNFFFGTESGETNVSGTRNLYLGYRTGKAALSSNNVFIGSEAGRFVTTASANFFTGYQAGFNTTTGGVNMFTGYQAGFKNTTGDGNLFAGYQAGYSTNTGNQNTFIGYQAGFFNNTGDRNLAIGFLSQKLNVSGNRNIAVGNYALYGNRFGDNNLALGSNVVALSDIGDNNITIGSETARAIKNPNFDNNTILGYRAGNQAFASENSIILGANSLTTGAGGQNNVIVGQNCAQNLGLGQTYRTITSSQTQGFNTIAFNNSSSFVKEGQYLAIIPTNDTIEPFVSYTTNVSGNGAVLASSLNNNISVGDYVYLIFGEKSGIIDSASAGNSYFITEINLVDAVALFTVGDKITLQSLSSTTTQTVSIVSMTRETGSVSGGTSRITIDTTLASNYNEGDVFYYTRQRSSFVGDLDTSIAAANILMGTSGGYNLTTGSKNIGIGDNTLYSLTTSKYNVAIGSATGYNVNTSNNLLLGTHTGYYIDSSSNGKGANTMIGFCAGHFSGFNASCSRNLYLGNNVGQVNQGSNNIFIGLEENSLQSATSTGNTTYSNKLAVYKSLAGVPSDPVIGGDMANNRVGIKTLSPVSSFEVQGSIGHKLSTFGQASTTLAYGSSYTVYSDKAATTITISSGSISGFPSKGNALIDSEIIHFRSKTSSSLTNLNRSVHGTTTAHHEDGSYVYNLGTIRYNGSLSSAVGIADKAISVNNISSYDTSGLLLIDSEIIQYGGKNGGFAGVSRAIYGSTAASHTSGTEVYQIATQRSVTSALVNSSLSTSINSSQTTIPFNASLLLSDNRALVIGSEIITYASKAINLFGFTRGTNGTSANDHASGSTVLALKNNTTSMTSTTLAADLTGSGTTSFQVASFDNFTSSGYILVGTEVLKYNKISLTGLTRGTNSTTAGIHGIGTKFFLVSSGTTAFSTTSTLDGSINDSQTNLTLDSAVGFTSSGGTVVINAEVITYTATSGNFLTGLTRGVGTSTASLHDAGDTVYLVGSYITNGTAKTLSASGTTLVFSSGQTSFTNSGTILIGSELVTYTGIRAETLIRGVGVTNPSVHSSGDTVYNIGINYNGTSTTLIGYTTSNAASIITSGIPLAGNLSGTILINDELITFNGGYGLKGVTRGASGTTATTHTSGSRIVVFDPSVAVIRSSLGSDLSSTAGGIDIVNNTAYSSSGILLIESELINYQNKNTLDGVVRGALNSTASTHTSGTLIKNFVSSTLNSNLQVDITSTTDAIPLVDATTSFSNSGQVVIESYNSSGTGTQKTREVVSYTSKDNSLVILTVPGERAFYGSSIAPHTSGATVYEITTNTSAIPVSVIVKPSDAVIGTELVNSGGVMVNSSLYTALSSSGVIRLETELIRYQTKANGLSLINNGRGLFGTTATTHTSGDTVYDIKINSSFVIPNAFTSGGQISSTDTAVPFDINNGSSSGTLLLDGELVTFSDTSQSLVIAEDGFGGFRGGYNSIASSHASGTIVQLYTTSGVSTIQTNGGASSYIGSDFIPLSSSTAFGSSGDVRVSQEIISYTSKNDTAKVTRGSINTTNTSHTALTNVYIINYNSGVSLAFLSGSSVSVTSSNTDSFNFSNSSGYNTSAFTSSGYLLIDPFEAGVEGEIVKYNKKNHTLRDITRGADQTAGRANFSGATVHRVSSRKQNVDLYLDIDNSQTEIPIEVNATNAVLSSGYIALDQEMIRHTNNDVYIFNTSRGVSSSINTTHSGSTAVNVIRTWNSDIPVDDNATTKNGVIYPLQFKGPVVRGTNSTTATSHSSGATIYHLKSDDITNYNTTTISGITFNASATTLYIADSSNFNNSAAGGGVALIGSELITYADKNSVPHSLIGITRGILGTTATSHNSGSTVYAIANNTSNIYQFTNVGTLTASGGTVSFNPDASNSHTVINPNGRFGFGSSGTILIDSELIQYTIYDYGDFSSNHNIYGYYSLTGVTRGASGTTGSPFNEGFKGFTLGTSLATNTTLASTINSTASIIQLTSITGFSTTSGTALIVTQDISSPTFFRGEFVRYRSTSGNYLKKCLRGWEYTIANPHPSANSTVYSVTDPKMFKIATTTSNATTINIYPENCQLNNFGSSGYSMVDLTSLISSSATYIELVNYTGFTGQYSYKALGITRGKFSTTAAPYTQNTPFHRIADGTTEPINKTLNGSITSSATTIILNNGDYLDLSGGYVIIGSEIIKYNNRSGTNLQNCIRGLSTTEAASHSNLDKVYFISINNTPVRGYLNTTTSNATSFRFDMSTGYGVDMNTSAGLALIGSEIVEITSIVGKNPIHFDLVNTSFAIEGEILSSTQEYSYTKSNFTGASSTVVYDYFIFGGNGVNINADAYGPTYAIGAADGFAITDISGNTANNFDTTVKLTSSDSAYYFPKNGGAYITRRSGDPNGGGIFTYKYRTGLTLNEVSLIMGFNNNSVNISGVYLMRLSDLAVDIPNEILVLSSATTADTSIASSDISKISLNSNIFKSIDVNDPPGITSGYGIQYLHLDGDVSHYLVKRSLRGTTISSHATSVNITRISGTYSSSLSTGISAIETDIPINQPNTNLGTSGILLIGTEYLGFGEASGIKGVTRGALNSSASAHTTGSSFYHYQLGASDTTRKSMNTSQTYLYINDNTGMTSGSGTLYYLIEDTGGVAGVNPEIITANSSGWNSFDVLTRGFLGTTPQTLSNSGAPIFRQINTPTAPSTLRSNIDGTTLYIPLTDGSSYPATSTSYTYYLIDSELVKLTSKQSLDNITRNVYSTSSATLSPSTTAFYITSRTTTGTLRQSITSSHQIIPCTQNSINTYPSNGGLLLIDQEWIVYSNRRSFDLLSRGQFGTTATNHSANSTFFIVDNVSGYRTLNGNISSLTYAIPLSGSNTNYCRTTGGFTIADNNYQRNYIAIGSEIMNVETKATLDNLTRGYIGSNNTSHASTTSYYGITANGYSTLRQSIDGSASLVIPLGSGSSYSTSGIALIDEEYIRWIHKNSLDGLTRGQLSSSASAHLSADRAIVYDITTPDFTPANFQLDDNKVLLSDDVSGVKVSGSLSSFPPAGTLTIGSEKISFGSKIALADITRATNNTTASTHNINNKVYLLDNEANSSLTSSTLTADISAGVTILSLASASSFPSTGTVVVGSELITYNAKSGNNLTNCNRARLQTTAASHSSGAKVYAVDTTAIYSNLTASCNTTQRIIALDSNTNFGTSGTVLVGSEIMTYTSKNALTEITRGVDSTTPSAYPNGTTVTLTDLTLGETDNTVLVNTTAGNITINLPDSTGVSGRVYTVKKIVSGNTLTIDPYLSQTIDGASTISTTIEDASVCIQSDGTNWHIMHQYKTWS